MPGGPTKHIPFCGSLRTFLKLATNRRAIASALTCPGWRSSSKLSKVLSAYRFGIIACAKSFSLIACCRFSFTHLHCRPNGKLFLLCRINIPEPSQVLKGQGFVFSCAGCFGVPLATLWSIAPHLSDSPMLFHLPFDC